MSISRAFTTKRSKPPQVAPPMPQRSATMKHSVSSSGSIRHKISAPLELISTTNMLSYNAPDLYPNSASSISTSSDEIDVPALSHSRSRTPSNSSGSASPVSPEPNHLSCYFTGAKAGRESSSSTEDAPMIPKRALSHTKRSHELISRQRSMSRMSGGQTKTTMRSSIDMFGPAPPVTIPTEQHQHQHHPFGNELAQVTELAEEYIATGVKTGAIDEEEQFLLSRGLFKFEAIDYMNEIQGLFAIAFPSSPTRNPQMQTMWI